MTRKGGLRLAVAVLVAGTVIGTGSSAVAGRLTVRDAVYGGHTMSVAPRAGLGDNQFVRIRWSGFVAGAPVFFRQCTAHPTNVARDCTALYSDTGFTNSDGSGELYEQVFRGSVRSQSGKHFTCDAKTPCSIGVFANASLTAGSRTTISFGPSQSSCPQSTGTPIGGDGADEAGFAFFHWGLVTCKPPLRLNVSYIPANSEDGGENFAHGFSQFAVTGMPLSSVAQSQLRHRHVAFRYAPVTASGLVLAYKIFDQNQAQAAPGAQVTNLKLTPALVAQIFTGQLTNWQTDPTVTALNPGHKFPPTVRPLVRGDHSEANLLFTGWLTATAGSALPSDWPGAGDTYPIKYVTQNGAIVGGANLADALADPNSAQNSNDYYSIGYIGYIDSSEAAYYGLPVAKIENAAGQFVTATPASVDAAITHIKAGAGGAPGLPTYTSKDPKAYPMPVVTYATTPTSGVEAGVGATLARFLHYALTAGQHSLPAGYVPLPHALEARGLAAVGAIPGAPPGSGSPQGGNTGGGTPLPSGSGLPGGSSFPGGGSAGTPPPPASGSGNPGQKTTPQGAGGGHRSAGVMPTLEATAGRLMVPGLVALSLLALAGGIALELAGPERRARARALLRRATSVRRLRSAGP
ncbi:MAG: PstS family phosphate ABC transporter substrate-binding protein [Gaiellales bacterium]